MVIDQEECELEELDIINNLNGYTFYKVKVNGKSQYDEFVQDLTKNTNIFEELTKISALMEMFNDSPPLPKTKFRQFKINQRSDIYEFKSKHIRVYVIKKEKAFYIIRAGLKSNQEKDEKYMKERYAKVYLDI